MSQDMKRRDTLKLAGLAAALGAGLGVLLDGTDAHAQPGASAVVPPSPLKPQPGDPLKIKLDSAAQLKIAGYQQIKIGAAQVQLKMYSASGQFLYAANVPDEIARALTDGVVLQFKFHRAGGDQLAAPAAYAESGFAPLKLVAGDGSVRPLVKR